MKSKATEVRVSVSERAVLFGNRANLSARAVVSRLLALYEVDAELRASVAHFNTANQAAASSTVFGEQHAAAALNDSIRAQGKATAAAIAKARMRRTAGTPGEPEPPAEGDDDEGI